MNNIITDNMEVVYFVVRVNGVEVTRRYAERMMAEMAINSLPVEQQAMAEVVSITTNGDQLLLG